MTKAEMTARETATVTIPAAPGVEDVASVEVTVVRGNKAGTKVYTVFTAEVAGEEAKSMSGAFSKFCEAAELEAKAYKVPGVKDMDWVDPNAPSDDWHDYEGAEALGAEIAALVEAREGAGATLRQSNIGIARKFVEAESLLQSQAARNAWLDTYFPEGRNNSDASELRKLGNWPDALLDAAPKRYRSAKGLDKWLLDQRGFLAKEIVERASPDGRESVTVDTVAAAYTYVGKAVVAKLKAASDEATASPSPETVAARMDAQELAAVFEMHASNIKSAGGVKKAVAFDGGDMELVRHDGMKTPVCRAVISNFSDTAGDELLASIVRMVNALPTREEADAAGRAENERNRTAKTEAVVKEAAFPALDTRMAALHLFNIACSHEDLDGIAKQFSAFVEQVAAGTSIADVLAGMSEAEAEAAEADEAADAEDAA